MTASDSIQAARQDVIDGLKSWRIWFLLGTNDIRQRYHRSRFGQFWVVANVAVFIAAIGTVNSVLFQQNVGAYIPFLTVNYIAWLFVSSLVSDATAMFTQADGLLRQEALPRSIFVWRLLTRSLVVLAHNSIVVPIVFIIFGVGVTWTLPLALVGIVLALLAGAPIGFLIGLLCARFRDVPVIIGNLVTIAFFLSPVMWRPVMLRNELQWLLDHNPFAVFIRLISEPVLGHVPDTSLYVQAIVIAAFMWAVSALSMVRYRHRIIFWL